MFEASRAVSFWPKKSESYLEMERLLRDKLVYIATVNLHVFPEVYQLDTPKYPLCVAPSLSYIGKSSSRITSIMSCPEINIPYAKFDLQHVFVDPQTRKPSAIPEWWMQKYGNIRPEMGRPLKMENLKRPISCLSHELTVHPRDCDQYQHTSWKNYGYFCYDTCCVFVRRSLYKNVNRESLDFGLKSMTVSFRKESLELEKLNLYSWEDDTISNKVFFEIQNQNNEICCQASIEFYSENSAVSKIGETTSSKL